MTTYLYVYLGSLVLALLTTPVVIWLARRIGAVDRPGVRTVHELPIPRIGGVAIFLSAMALIVAVIFVNNDIGQAFRAVRLQLFTLLGSATLIFVVGLVDDLKVKGLPARVKFMVELLVALGLCLAGVRISEIALTDQWIVPLGEWGWLLTVLWLIGITNAVNLCDGLDGLAAGIAAIACGAIAVLAVHDGTIVMAIFALALVGSLTGFLVFNLNPAKVFMGDCGSLFLGFTIAASSVMCMTKSSAFVGLALPALALGVPIFDTLFSMLRRFLERRSMFAPDRSHFHHQLLELGLNQRHVVVAIYLVTLLAAGLGLFMMVGENAASLVIFACILLLLLILFRVVGAVRLHETMSRLQEKYARNQTCKRERQAFEQLQLRFRQVRNNDQWWRAVCEAGERMDFAWLSLTTTHRDGRIETELWRAPRIQSGFSRIVTMMIPLEDGDPELSRQFEIAICTNGSLEAASRRATLFGRLLDESQGPGTASEASLASGV